MAIGLRLLHRRTIDRSSATERDGRAKMAEATPPAIGIDASAGAAVPGGLDEVERSSTRHEVLNSYPSPIHEHEDDAA